MRRPAFEMTADETAETTGAHNPQARARGTVYLIGAGPGDPDLITVKALRCLRAADVVVYDRLIDPALLDEARLDAERVYVGKGAQRHSAPQEHINTLLVERAQRGQMVVRLKGGDPFVFGRGGEEALALAAAGVSFEIVPGVTSAIAVPAYAGIPVTHRGYASVVTFVTGHAGATAPESSPPPDWQALARLGGTLVILMGVATLPAITQSLMEGGLDGATPAAVIQQGTTPSQRVVTGALGAIAGRAAAAHLRSPAITVIGAVAGLRESLAWFEATIPQGQVSDSCESSDANDQHALLSVSRR